MRSRTYRFTEKDPVCDEIMNMVDAVGLRGKHNTGKVAILATKAKATIDGILYGDTRRPQNATVMSIATALGFERKWVTTSGKWKLEEELAAARTFIKAERKRMAKENPVPRKKRTARKRATKKGKPHLRLVA